MPQVALFSTNLPAGRIPPRCGELQAQAQTLNTEKCVRLVNFQQVIEISVGKTLSAEEMTLHDHDGKGEKEACVQSVRQAEQGKGVQNGGG